MEWYVLYIYLSLYTSLTTGNDEGAKNIGVRQILWEIGNSTSY